MARVVEKSNPITLYDEHGEEVAFYPSEMVDTIKNTVAKGATDSELIMFLTVANKYNLDPFLNEIYFSKMKTKDGEKSTLLTSRDGYRKIAKSQQDYKSHQSAAVYENDEFEMQYDFGEIVGIKHTHKHTDRGKLVGAWCVLITTDGTKYAAYVERTEYDTGKNAWGKYKTAMLEKVAQNKVFKNYANINGVNDVESMPSEYADGVEALEDNTIDTKLIEGD